ncbi:Putative inner membrane protein [Laribacter hongkongensis HLHK9]|uniref:Inner membrane protein n=1 Tax=Laribacter hongkongensis (strain HLHK9) TaxID=557598 RepID=C1D833_LARHH|nr:tail protein X [Laribacter hongkongensis]ACO74623.1 Putative inner membrane protein [Laribacter hongkongensis HLHK9]
MEYIEHITSSGERWDTLAWRYYGDATLYRPIIEANPHLRILPSLAAGLPVRIPVLESDADTLPPEDLPPWKR